MKREFCHLETLSHPNIIDVYELLVDPQVGMIYLVMEYFEGGEMFEVLSSIGKYSETKAKNLFKQLLDGI